MKYIATINGKRYEVEVERVEGYKSLDRNGVAAPKAPALAGTETGSSGTCSSTSPGCSTGTCSSTGSGSSTSSRRHNGRGTNAG